jgi:hypothetical protein
MSNSSRIRSATNEDYERHFGSSPIQIGVPVRPKPNDASDEPMTLSERYECHSPPPGWLFESRLARACSISPPPDRR